MEKLIQTTIKNIKPLDRNVMGKVQKRLDNLTKPVGSLGRLEELAKKIAGIMKETHPRLDRKVIFTLAGDHGVTEEKVSAYPKEVTAQMVFNFVRGGAAINVLAKHVGAEVLVVDMGVASNIKDQISDIKTFKDKKVGFGTNNMTKGPAMARDMAEKSILAGIEIVEATHIGTGAKVRQYVKIAKNCLVKMGTIVTRDISDE